MNLGQEHVGPWEAAGTPEREPVAPYCHGPGHRLDWDDTGEWLERTEDCPACKDGPVRNHWRWRLPEGIDL